MYDADAAVVPADPPDLQTKFAEMDETERKDIIRRTRVHITDLTTKLQLANEVLLQVDATTSSHIVILQVKQDGKIESVRGNFGARAITRNQTILETTLVRIISLGASAEVKPANSTELRAFVREAKQRYGVCKEMTEKKLGTCP